MSGFESSVQNSSAAEAVSFTVHRPPEPALARSRVLSGRLRMLLILLACAAPVIASYLTYYVIRPEGRTNYGTLIQPSRAMPADLGLQSLDGRPVTRASLRGQWLLVSVAGGGCGSACEQRLYFQRQVQAMLGRERDRLDRVWLVTDSASPAPALLQAAAGKSSLTTLRADAAAVARWLQAEPGRAVEDHLYVVDPMGEWMLRLPAEPQPARVKRDLDRLLRATGSWDRAGR
jgi:hypothetical protein